MNTTPIDQTDEFWRCHRKSEYGTLEKARKYARIRTEASGEEIMAYQCRYCGKFHIGHVTTEAIRKSRQRKARVARKREQSWQE